MSLDAFDPFGVDDARTVDTQRFFAEVTDLNCFWAGAIPEVGFGLCTCQCANGRDHSAVELKVIVRIEDVVFAIVLIVQCHLNGLETLREDRLGLYPIRTLAVRVTAPCKKGSGKVVVILPVSRVDQRQDTRSVRSGLRTEDTIASLSFRFVRGEGLGELRGRRDSVCAESFALRARQAQQS
jgi:hypothetical protein